MIKTLEELFAPPASEQMEADIILSSKQLTEAVRDYLQKTNLLPEDTKTFWVQYWNDNGNMTARIAFCEKNPQQGGK